MKSKSLKVGLLFTLVVFAVFSLGSAFAQPPIPKKPIPKKPTSPKPFPLKMQADLGIYSVGNKRWEGECSACSNTLSRVGAVYLNDLTVLVVCHSAVNVKKTGGTIEVTYYDLVQGKSVTKSKPFSNLSCQIAPKNISVTVVNHPLLINLSTGIRATVKPDAPVEDPNPGNNRMTVRNPSKMCIRTTPL